ncbi:hypothetical protein SAMN04515675_3925 [Pseudomonas costantinii]|uniref:Uncharacterized protein n=1 Tax=Pseudomonas costantinii TaxID=168469 RepID=A0A1S2V912_9PSED|nr:hypothetical protein BFL40_04930 [Pseudomonas costantinii]OIN54706.1 hypothetical protein BFL40_02225 [Pseudomonas costantinii]OIN55368.1 hypothetical protein BFL40_01325 [Pseudomonas costantinii]SEE09642.1 hypothetical protein SAMN04515675_3925 [Pseudomonas costantinii]
MLMQSIPRRWLFHSPIQSTENIFVIFSSSIVAKPLGAYGASAACAGIGVATVGVGGLVCGLVVVGAASALGGKGLASVGESFGEYIYERTQ